MFKIEINENNCDDEICEYEVYNVGEFNTIVDLTVYGREYISYGFFSKVKFHNFLKIKCIDQNLVVFENITPLIVKREFEKQYFRELDGKEKSALVLKETICYELDKQDYELLYSEYGKIELPQEIKDKINVLKKKINIIFI